MKDLLKQYLRERPLFLSLIRAKEAELFQKFLPLKRPVLDVGCGDGMFANIAFANKIKNHKVNIIDIGLDLEESRIDEAGRLGIYKKLLTYDGLSIPVLSNSFSTIVSNCVLEHVADLEKLLKEIRRVLKRDGIFLTTVMAKPWEDYLYGTKIFGRFYKDFMRKIQIHRNLLPKAEWDKAFENSGFKIVRTIGYLSPRACQLIDICHYLSLPSLISYTLFGSWVLFPQLTSLYPIDYFAKMLSQKVSSQDSGALFYVLRK